MSETLVGFEPTPVARQTFRSIDRWMRSLVHQRLRALREGYLVLVDAGGTKRFGDSGAALRATIWVDDASFYRSLVTRGGLGAAEAYMDGHWRSDDLATVVRILARDREALEGVGRTMAPWVRPLLSLGHSLRANTREGSRKNIAAHYDLGNEFFELFLDPTLAYSCGVFERPDATMEEASVAKFERVCRKLSLSEGDHVLEIGTGWGGFAIHAASQYGCRVTTTTISRRQCELARARVAEAGLGDRVEVLLQDYRDLEGCYDKLVSIEMIEAVGHRHLDEFMHRCGELLRPEGQMVLQAITVADRDLPAHLRSIDFIKKYIFPGGELVSVGSVAEAASRETDLRFTHLEDITLHYAETLRRWRASMGENIAQMRSLGLGDEFLRMWEFYLCYCEGGFEERKIGTVQMAFEKPLSREASVLCQR